MWDTLTHKEKWTCVFPFLWYFSSSSSLLQFVMRLKFVGHQNGSFPFRYIYSVQHFLTSELRSFTDCKMLKCLDDFMYHSMWHIVTNSTTAIWEEKGEKQSASWKADGGFFPGQRWRIAQDDSSLNRHRAQSTEREWCRCLPALVSFGNGFVLSR